MPDTGHHRPVPASCEEWDETTETILPETRTSAKVTAKRTLPELSNKASYERRRHDGSDSGYSSKAGTIESDLSAPRRKGDVRVGAAIVERVRQPYSMAAARPEVQRQSSNRAKDMPNDLPRPKKFKHIEGCQICDYYGYHVENVKEAPRAASHGAKPTSPKTSRGPGQFSAKDDQAAPRMTRRLSSTTQSRPVSMFGAPPTFQHQTGSMPSPISYAPTLMMPLGWSTPGTPTVQYSPVAYPHAFAPMPSIAQNVPYVEHVPPSYFEQHPTYVPVPEIRPPKPSRRQTMNGETVILQKPRSRSPEKVSMARDDQSTRPPHKITRSEDFDRKAMPPPPRPGPAEVVVAAHRPGLKKHTTYTVGTSSSSNRRSLILNDDSIPYLPPSSAPLPTHRSSPTRPPSSYRGPSFSESDRDRAALPTKSSSYSTPTHITKVASSTTSKHGSGTDNVPRRTTLPTSTLPRTTRERHEDEAEAYQARAALTSTDLTAEALRKYASRRGVSERSETGSSHSHRSKGSGSGRSSGGNNNNRNSVVLNINGATMIIPATDDGRERNIKVTTSGKGVSIDLGEQGPKQKRIEGSGAAGGAESVVSRTSSRAQSGSVVSSGGGKGKEREREKDHDIRLLTQGIRRMSYDDETPRGRYQDQTQYAAKRRESSSRRRQSVIYETPASGRNDSASRRRQSVIYEPPVRDESATRRRQSVLYDGPTPTREEILWREEHPHQHNASVFDDDDHDDERYNDDLMKSPETAAQLVRRQRSQSRSQSRARNGGYADEGLLYHGA